jgi:hypothetical protein
LFGIFVSAVGTSSPPPKQLRPVPAVA